VELLEILRYDYELRPFISKKLGLPSDEMDFIFGRPLIQTIMMFGLQVIREPDGSFQMHRDYGAYENKYHAAEDCSAEPGSPVYAIAEGRISFSGPMDGYGWLVVIDHPQHNLYSLYGHLSSRRWRKEWGRVEKGEHIAYIGDTDENGSSPEYGQMHPHLHFGLRQGQRIDYPRSGDTRWMAGWTYACPESLGWLAPSRFIDDLNAGSEAPFLGVCVAGQGP